MTTMTKRFLGVHAGLGALALGVCGCGSASELSGRSICDEAVVQTVAGPSVVTSMGFSADEAGQAIAFDGDALVTYDDGQPDALVPMTLSVVPTGVVEVVEVRAGPDYDAAQGDDAFCAVGSSFLRTVAQVSWSIAGHLEESRSSTVHIHAVDVVEEDGEVTPAQPELDPAFTEAAEATVTCSPVFESRLRPSGVVLGYSAACEDGASFFGDVFEASPIR